MIPVPWTITVNRQISAPVCVIRSTDARLPIRAEMKLPVMKPIGMNRNHSAYSAGATPSVPSARKGEALALAKNAPDCIPGTSA